MHGYQGLLVWTELIVVHRPDPQPIACRQDMQTGTHRLVGCDSQGATLLQHACMDSGERQS